MHLGCSPSAPNHWVISATEWVKLDGKAFTRFQVTAKAQAISQEILWRNASKHAFGVGLETGIPSLEPARKAKRYFKKHGLHEAAQGLENIVDGIYRL